MRSNMKYKLGVRTFCSFLLAVLALASGCDRRPLEVMEPMKATVRLEFDWETRYGFTPESMTVMIWRENSHNPIVNTTREVHSMQVELDPDWDKGVRYMTDPEAIGVVSDSFTITDEMMLDQVTFHPYETWIKQRLSDTRFFIDSNGVYILPLIIKPVITNLNVYVEVKGIKNLSSLTGSITGMADGFYLYSFDRTDLPRAMLLPTDKWTKYKEEVEHKTVYLYHQTSVFGLPHGKEHVSSRDEDFNVLTLYATLIDGTELIYTYNVGKIIRYRNLEEGMEFNNDMHLELELDLYVDINTVGEDNIPIFPDVDPSEQTDSAFEADVEPWQEGESTILKF